MQSITGANVITVVVTAAAGMCHKCTNNLRQISCTAYSHINMKHAYLVH